MKVRMREIAHVIDDHRMMGLPGEIERYARPSILTFEFRDRRNLPLLGKSSISRKDPDQTIANFYRVSPNAERWHLPAKEFVGNIDNLPFAIISPAVITAHQIASV